MGRNSARIFCIQAADAAQQLEGKEGQAEAEQQTRKAGPQH